MFAARDVPLGIATPDWYRHRVGPAVLWLPFDPSLTQRSWMVLGDGEVGGAVLARFTSPPSFLDRAGAWADERALGLEPLGYEGMRALAAVMPFDELADVISALHAGLEDHSQNQQFHLDLADHLMLGEQQTAKLKRLLSSGEAVAVCAEQTVLALARIAVDVAGTQPSVRSSQRRDVILGRLLLGATGIAMSADERADEPVELDSVDILLQLGGLIAREWLPAALARTRRIFVDLAESEQARARADFCPLNDWLQTAFDGLGVDEQLILGVLVLGATSIETGPRVADLTRRAIQNDWLEIRCRELSLSHTAASALLLADRQWFQHRFREVEDELGLSREQGAQGWNRIPFDERPLLARNDHALLWSQRALISWMTDGILYRVRNAAPDDQARRRFATFYGWLFEQHVRELFATAHGDRPAGGGRVVGPFKYRVQRREVDSTDIIIDHGPDLVLVEVYSGRLSHHSRLVGDPDILAENLDRLLVGKARQLSDRIDEYLEGKYEIEGVKREVVRRVWPLIVVGAPLTLNEALGHRVSADLDGRFTDPRVQGLSVLGPDDVDRLCGLIETGYSLVEILERRAGAYEWLDFRRLLMESPHLPSEPKLTTLTRASIDSFFRDLGERAGLDMKSYPEWDEVKNDV